MIYVGIAVFVAYILGSFPTAYVFGKALKGIDIRQHGSGNVGATNVARVIGKVPGVIVLIIDFLKGFAAVTLLPLALQKWVFQDEPVRQYVYILIGIAVITGHVWTCFLRFKGGKGVATTGGVMAGLSPAILLGCLVVWACVFAVWKYVSLASIAAACALPVFAVISGRDVSFVIFCGILCLAGVYLHRNNIKRLIQGTESRIVKIQKR